MENKPMQAHDMWFIFFFTEAHQIQRETNISTFYSDTIEVSLTDNDQTPPSVQLPIRIMWLPNTYQGERIHSLVSFNMLDQCPAQIQFLKQV